MSIADKDAFIRAQTRLLPVPHAPEISLHIADVATELWSKTEDELGEIGLPPPFWAFAWAGGQALARYLLDHPDSVRGRCVLDFAAGSGLVGIAAAKAGATQVTAVDIDAFAIELGYEGNRKGNLKTIKRFETGERAVPLPVAKLAWLLMQNGLPDWPSGLEAVVADDDAGEQT